MPFTASLVWTGIVICFIRGLFVFDMGGSAEGTYPTASDVCLAGSIIAAAILVHGMTRREPS